ncbi:hypothetical protein C8Q76DRAFT_568081, partial [Earliella scabrosa]
QVEQRWRTWDKHRGTQSRYLPQLEWEAHICEYVSFLNTFTSTSKPRAVPPKLQILGPRFIPPTYLHVQRRATIPDIVPDTAYLKPLNVVHPFYYPDIESCPQCDATGTILEPNGWNPKGHREVHGVMREETAIGIQYRCNRCKAKYGKGAAGGGEDGSYCFVTTGQEFWAKREHWELPGECATSR